MNKDALKEVIYGGITALMQNRKYYYHSSVSASYSHWTDEGKEALAEYMSFIGWKMVEAENKDLDHRAKQMVINSLKGEKI